MKVGFSLFILLRPSQARVLIGEQKFDNGKGKVYFANCVTSQNIVMRDS